MNWLLLDVGNTTLKWALLKAGEALPGPGAAAPGGALTALMLGQGIHTIDEAALQTTFAAELAQARSRIAKDLTTPTPVASWGCAVAASDKIAAIEAAVRAAQSAPVQWLGATRQFQYGGVVLRNGYREPEQLGSDRWHAMIGARARYADVPLLIISAGTATTVDAVGADGRFLGGVIAPGVEMMRAALARGTARLPLAAGDYVELPDNTDDAIRTGILDAQIGLIVQRMHCLRRQCGSTVQVVVSGGNGPTLHALLRAQSGLGTMALEPDLVLLGLWYRARAQREQASKSPNP